MHARLCCVAFSLRRVRALTIYDGRDTFVKSFQVQQLVLLLMYPDVGAVAVCELLSHVLPCTLWRTAQFGNAFFNAARYSCVVYHCHLAVHVIRV